MNLFNVIITTVMVLVFIVDALILFTLIYMCKSRIKEANK